MRPEYHSADERANPVCLRSSALDVDMPPSGRNATAAALCLKSRCLDFQAWIFKRRHLDCKMRIRPPGIRCPKCHQRIEADKGVCDCKELHRRSAYDEARARRKLVPLYRPPNMR